MRRDLLNHRVAPVRPLPKPRTVFRYTSKANAAKELRSGLPPFRHMTSTGSAGRPMRGSTAAKTYGLPRSPRVRETVRLPKGTPAIVNRAQGGARGRGEIVLPRKLDRSAIVKVVPLRR